MKKNIKTIIEKAYYPILKNNILVKGKQIEGLNSKVYHYNQEGNIIESILYSHDNKLHFRSVSTYKNGKKQQTKFYNKNNEFNLIHHLIYNKIGLLSTLEITKADGAFDSEYNYEYDEKGHLIKTTWKSAGVNSCFLQKNDEYGNPIEVKKYLTDGNILDTSSKDTYNDKQQTIKSEWETKDGDKSIFYMKYNKQGDLIEDIEEDIVKKLTSKVNHTYQYDGYNNWIAQISYEDDEPTTITHRQIEYYE